MTATQILLSLLVSFLGSVLANAINRHRPWQMALIKFAHGLLEILERCWQVLRPILHILAHWIEQNTRPPKGSL